MRALTPIQMARVFMASYPYNPGKLCRLPQLGSLFGHSCSRRRCRCAPAAPAAAAAAAAHCVLRIPVPFPPLPADMTRICPWLFAKPLQQQQQQQHLPAAAGHFIAPMPAQPIFVPLGQKFGPAVPAVPTVPAVPAVPASSQAHGVHSMHGMHSVHDVVPVGVADVAGADLAPAPADPLAHADVVFAADGTPGGFPGPDSDALLDLLDDDELDFLIADLAGNCNNDVGHLLAATSPRLP